MAQFPLSRIVPTEEDMLFRNKLIHGIAHDEGVAFMRGVSGHAGLFGKAIDVAKVWDMMRRGGVYGGKRYLSKQSLDTFTTCAFCHEGNRRGLGFDKPQLVFKAEESNVPEDVSLNSYGHSGFTGTLAWVDKDAELVYVFLSNRIHPTRHNTTIYDLEIRTRIHKLVYKLMPRK